MMAVHPDLIELICCPRCHGKLALGAGPAGETFACHACRVAYPIDPNGIPQLLLDDAQPLPAVADAAGPAGPADPVGIEA